MATNGAARRFSGPRLKILRLERGLSQAALARKAGVSQATVCRAETGAVRPPGRTIGKLAAALGVERAALEVEPRPVPPPAGSLALRPLRLLARLLAKARQALAGLGGPRGPHTTRPRD